MLDERIKKWIRENAEFLVKLKKDDRYHFLLDIKVKMYNDIPNAVEEKLWNNVCDNYNEFARLVSIEVLRAPDHSLKATTRGEELG